jgi:integron-associated effector binding protein
VSDQTVVEREPVAVMWRRIPDELPVMQATFAEVEASVGLRGRTYYGAFDPADEMYLVCVVLQDGDDPAAHGLELGELPGGRFARKRLRGEAPALYEQIGPAFSELHAAHDVDRSRLQLEHYRRNDEIDILVPVR